MNQTEILNALRFIQKYAYYGIAQSTNMEELCVYTELRENMDKAFEIIKKEIDLK